MIKTSDTRSQLILYEDTFRYDTWLKFVFSGVLIALFLAGLILISQDVIGALVMFGDTLFVALILKAVFPQRLQIFQDRVKIVLGGPFSVTIPLSDIKEVKKATAIKGYFYWGLRFATSNYNTIEIVRKRGMSLVITPTSPDMFIEQVNKAISAASNLG